MRALEYFLNVTYGCGRLGREVKASEVSVANSIVHEAVAAEALVVGDGVVGAGVEVDQVDHVEDGLQEPQDVLVVADAGVKTREELGEVSVLQQPRQPEEGALDPELDVEQVSREQRQSVVEEPTISDIIPHWGSKSSKDLLFDKSWR